ncbi:hypothetical protein WME81_37350 [Sorangium sp. So ce1078]
MDFTGALGSLHDRTVRLYAWVDEHYHRTPRAALFGKSPAPVYEEYPHVTDDLDERKLRDALTTQARRRVRRDNTLSMDGEDWETDLGFLAGHLVTVSRCRDLCGLGRDVRVAEPRYHGQPDEACRGQGVCLRRGAGGIRTPRERKALWQGGYPRLTHEREPMWVGVPSSPALSQAGYSPALALLSQK